jgi:hypothetical protein
VNADDSGRPGALFLRGRQEIPRQGESPVADLGFVVLTVALFAALTVLVRTVERW